MTDVVHRFSTHILDRDGRRYVAAAVGAERADRTWVGWIEFSPVDGNGSILRTDNETSQPNRAALEYWAAGLEPVYLDGAFARAQGKLP
jgi:hypothetical protein